MKKLPYAMQKRAGEKTGVKSMRRRLDDYAVDSDLLPNPLKV